MGRKESCPARAYSRASFDRGRGGHGRHRKAERDDALFSGARGEVWARTWYDLTVRVPLTYEKKVYTGKEKRSTVQAFNSEEEFWAAIRAADEGK